jgi:S-formylglutathione hydrolase FrmB
MMYSFAWVVLLWACLGGAVPAQAGGVLAESLISPALGHAWAYTIYLPQDYQGSTARYPVVYLLHGASQDEAGWVRDGGIDALADKLIARRDIPPCIIVMPAGYMSWYVDAEEKMETAIVEDLIPEIERRFRTKRSRDSRSIAGFSMGGYGALRLALRHPDLFSAAALLSPAIYTPEPPPTSAARKVAAFRTNGVFDAKLWASMNWPALLDRFADRHLTVRMHVSAGREDYFYTDVAAQGFFDAWRARGWPGELLLEPGSHDYPFWRKMAPRALRYLLNPPPSHIAGISH